MFDQTNTLINQVEASVDSSAMICKEDAYQAFKKLISDLRDVVNDLPLSEAELEKLRIAEAKVEEENQAKAAEAAAEAQKQAAKDLVNEVLDEREKSK